jgi:hypothetical protein
VGAGVLAPDGASLPELAADSPLADELSLAFDAALVEVVEVVEVVCAEDASALVLVGGVISGVLLGTASETVVLPHAPSAIAHSAAAHASSVGRALTTDAPGARRALTAAPYACRTSGSR